MTKAVVTVAAASLALVGGTSAVAPAQAAKKNPLVGTWTRKNSCAAFVKAATSAGLRGSLKQWLVGAGYFTNASQISMAMPCRGATNAKHSHFFTVNGAFGSYDQNGQQVDDGDYKIVSPRTLSFPSHAREFGHKITVHYRFIGRKLTFSVVVPKPCTGKCRDVTGWALSAFYLGPLFSRTR